MIEWSVFWGVGASNACFQFIQFNLIHSIQFSFLFNSFFPWTISFIGYNCGFSLTYFGSYFLNIGVNIFLVAISMTSSIFNSFNDLLFILNRLPLAVSLL